jgi:hypothetical protein
MKFAGVKLTIFYLKLISLKTLIRQNFGLVKLKISILIDVVHLRNYVQCRQVLVNVAHKRRNLDSFFAQLALLRKSLHFLNRYFTATKSMEI